MNDQHTPESARTGDGLKHWHPALPKAIDGCDCPCHSTAGMVHVVPCCGAGSINGPYKRGARNVAKATAAALAREQGK